MIIETLKYIHYICSMKSSSYQSLIEKYDKPIPRYTSYPTVPYWEENKPSNEEWFKRVKFKFKNTNDSKGISLYIHFPYCEKGCTYCACTKYITHNHSKEDSYIDALKKEWDNYLSLFETKPKLKELHLGGGTPTFFSPENLTEILSYIIDSSIVDKDKEFSFEADPKKTTEEHLIAMYRLGFTRLSLGVQDFDLAVQKVINRVQPFEIVKTVTDKAREIGYRSVNFDLIYGLPKQTQDSIEATIQLVKQLLPDRIAFYSYAHIPWKEKRQRGFSDSDIPMGEEKRKLYNIGHQLLTDGGYIDIGMDHFSLKSDNLYIARQNGKLHRNFMGYTTTQSEILIGLGVSAISDCGDAFVQNIKEVPEYEESLKNSEIKYIKGHFLSEVDTLHRETILDIACDREVDLNGEISNHLTEQEKLRLDSFKEEKIINIENSKLTVTKMGLTFLRNVCSVFDQKLNSSKKIKSKFSKSI